MKKRFLLGILTYVFSVQLLSAQICQPSQMLSPGVTSSSGLSSGPTGQFTSPCTFPPNPTPTPTPTPPPPTPSPTPVIGVVGPKYVVMTVTYAPPGSGSSVLYSNSNMLGTSVSLTNSFTSSTSQSTQVGGGIKINLGIFSISIGSTSTDSKQFTQEADTTSSVAMNQTTTLSTTIPGPSSSAVGLDHDVDIIWVWLNPLMTFTANSSTSLTWNGFGFDARDPVGDMDIIGIPVAYLNGHQAIPADVADVLARRWSPRLPCDSTDPFCAADGTEDPGLNANDLAAILTADPFANPSYVINIPAGSNCTADGRFCRTTNQNLQYEPPPAGGQPITQSYSMIHQTTDMAGQTATDTRQVTFGTDLNGSVDITPPDKNGPSLTNPIFTIMFSADLKKSKSLTTTNKFNAASSDQVGQTTMVTVKGPASTDNYTGPVEFEVFQDNIYGSFMFGFIPAPTFNLFSSPASQSVVQGSCTSYTASVSALVSGFNSTVALSVSGLPTNATASFSPASVTGAGSSTLTICTTASTATGTRSLTINGTSGIEVHSTGVSLTVNAPAPPPPTGNFSLSASPASLELTAAVGSTITTTITVSPTNGFNSPVSLSVSGGLTASLSAASVNGSGSVTLTVRAGAVVAPGNYTVTVTGTSGTLSHSVPIAVTVDAGGGGCRTCAIQ